MSHSGPAARIPGGFAAIFLAALLLAGCSGGTEGQYASGENAILVRGGGPEPDSLDPQ